MPSSRESSQPRDWTQVSHIAGGFFTIWATREAPVYVQGPPGATNCGVQREHGKLDLSACLSVYLSSHVAASHITDIT